MEKRIEGIIQVVAGVALAIGCLMVLKPFLAALLSAAILCFSTWPLYSVIERRLGGRRTLAALAMTLLMVVVLVLPLALIAGSYVDDVPQLAERLRDALAEGLPMPPGWVASIPLVGDSLDAGWREIAGSKAALAEVLKRIALPARAVRNGLERVAGNVAGRLLEIVGGTINGVMIGIVGTGLAQGLAAVIGFLIAGVPGALMLGFITAFLSIVPAGPPLIWIGATVWLFFQDQPGWAVFMALWGFFVVSGIDNIVKPLLISRGSSLPFVLVLLGVLGGILAFGFVGIFLGPVLLAVGFRFVRRWAAPRNDEV